MSFALIGHLSTRDPRSHWLQLLSAGCAEIITKSDKVSAQRYLLLDAVICVGVLIRFINNKASVMWKTDTGKVQKRVEAIENEQEN